MEFARRPAPLRIETERVVLTRPDPSHLEEIHAAVADTHEQLSPWMPWAEGEPATLEQREDDIRRLRAGFDRDEDYTYFLFERNGSRALGGAGLHPRVGTGGMELGYWIRATDQGQGLAVEVAGALIRAAMERVGLDRVQIHIEPGNVPSHRVVEKLGVPLEATLRRRFLRGGDLRDICVYTVFRDDYPGSVAATTEARFLDAEGRPLPPIG